MRLTTASSIQPMFKPPRGKGRGLDDLDDLDDLVGGGRGFQKNENTGMGGGGGSGGTGYSGVFGNLDNSYSNRGGGNGNGGHNGQGAASNHLLRGGTGTPYSSPQDTAHASGLGPYNDQNVDDLSYLFECVVKEAWDNLRAVEDVAVDIAEEQHGGTANTSVDTNVIGAAYSKLEYATFESDRSLVILEKVLGLLYCHLDHYRGLHRSFAQQQQARQHGFARSQDASRQKHQENAHEALQLTIGRVLEE